MAYKIFISYVARDLPLARMIAKMLEKVGAEAWLDRSAVKPGANFSQEIQDALRRSDEVIAILSEHSVQSPWINIKIGAALALGKRITPIMDRIKPEDLPPVLRSIQGVDLGRVDRYLKQLASRTKSESRPSQNQQSSSLRHISD